MIPRLHEEMRPQAALCLVGLLVWGFTDSAVAQTPRLRVGAAAVNLRSDDAMDIGGSLESRFTNEQEGQLRAVATVVELEGSGKLAIVACDILFLPRDLADRAAAEIEKTTGIPVSRLLVNATHTHHAPSVVPAHAFGASEEFREIVVKAIIQSVQDANDRLADCQFYFQLGEEKTVGANSRLQLDDGNISWLNPLREAAGNGKPTGPFDPQLPVLDFRDSAGKSLALVFNHSTHTIGTRSGRNVRSPSFYGLAAQELEQELGGTVNFLEGASGSTHNIASMPTDEAVKRLKQAVLDARQLAPKHPVGRLAAVRRPFKFKVRQFDDAEEDRNILRYTSRHAASNSDRIRQIFADSRDKMRNHQGAERETWVQVLLIGDIALVGVPAEYFTALGVDIKQRSPFKNTYVAELANDWIGYLPDREGHRLGGYQTWLGLHSYAEVGTGERMADAVVDMLKELAFAPADKTEPAKTAPAAADVPPSEPQSPERELAGFQLSDPNLSVELVAAEPDVVSPVAMAWNADGTLYVAEMIGYPQAEGLCRIAVLNDFDGDGRYQRTSTFDDKLNFVTSVMPFRKGLLVAIAPDLLYLEDSDGDGKADIRRVEWTGFSQGSQQLRANALHWGLDNWVYGANGRVNGNVRRPDAAPETAISLRTRDFRFDPLHGRFESLIGQSQFGQSHDDWGNRFLSLNTVPVRHVVLDDDDLGSYLYGPAAAVVNIAEPSDTGRIYPISPPPRQFNSEQSNYYNAMCGLSIYRGDQLGSEYAGNAFACESLSNLITRRVLTADGPTFLSRRAEGEADREFLAGKDSWFHPAFTTTGPDGAFYIADFYREFVEHPIYVADKKARAETDWRRGAEHGRLWRVVRKTNDTSTEGANAKADARIPRLQQASSADLVRQLSHPVSWWRETAQRLLVERQDKSAAQDLRSALRGAESPLGRSHALWTLRGLDSLDDSDLDAGLNDRDPNVRCQAIRAARGLIAQSRPLQERLCRLANDADGRVRFHAIVALGQADTPEIAKALADAIECDHDRWSQFAVLCAASRHPWPLLQALLERDSWRESPADWQVAFVEELAEQLVATRHAQLPRCLGWLNSQLAGDSVPGGVMSLASGLARGAETLGTTLQKEVDQNDAVWSVLKPSLKKLGMSTVGIATDAARPIEIRRAATNLLGNLSVENSDDKLLALLNPSQPAVIQFAAMKAVVNRGDLELCKKVFDAWQGLTSTTRRELFAATLRSSVVVAALLDAVTDEKIVPNEIPSHVRDALLQHRDAALQARAKQLLPVAASSDRQEVVTKYLAATPARGDVNRGVELFRQHCRVCHAVQGVGTRVGPDLAAVGSRRRDFLIIDILDPSRHVTPDFASYVAVTRNGRVFTGIIASEGADSVVFRRERGEQDTVLRSEIEELRPTGKSLMPEGFEKQISPEQLADILEFLRQPDGKRLVGDWRPLFNGRNLDGWYTFLQQHGKNADPGQIVTIDDGSIHCYKNTPSGSRVVMGYIATEQEFSNYHLRLQYQWGPKQFEPRLTQKPDAGLYYHLVAADAVWPRSLQFQIQIGDVGDLLLLHGVQADSWIDPTTKSQRDRTFLDPAAGGEATVLGGSGIVYQHQQAAYETPGWNTLELIVRGQASTHLVNGHIVNRCENIRIVDPSQPDQKTPLTKGRIALEIEATEIQYRNVEIRPLAP